MDPREFTIKHEDLVIEEDSLGFGTFGVVHKAKWRSVDVAVKYFNNKTISTDPSFKRETEILRSIKHKNIIKLFGMGDKGKQHFMVMELAPMSLDYVIHEGKTEYDYDYINVLHWSLQLAEALDYCHNREIQVIHRDIKPPNVLLFDSGMVLKVCDFGTAKLVDTATLPDTFIGTPFYLAPEIMQGKHSHKCDIFSFAVTVWEMVSRHKPVLNLNTKEKLHPYTIFMNIGNGERLPKILGLPRVMDELIDRCWAQSPNDRPPAEKVVEQLIRVLKKLPNCKPLKVKGEPSRTGQEDHQSQQQADEPQHQYRQHYDNTDGRLDDGDETLSESVPMKATTESDYYVYGLMEEDQPFVPIPNCPESQDLYEKYCSYMLQSSKAQNELNELLRQQEQLNQQYDSEIHRQTTITEKVMKSKTLDSERVYLEDYLRQLKLS